MRGIKTFETKSFVFDGYTKDVDKKKGIVVAAWAGIGNIDLGRDKIMPGAFKKTIIERGPNGSKKIKHCLNHDLEKGLGMPLVMEERPSVLYVETQFANNTRAKDTLELYEIGYYNEHSIGYRLFPDKVKKIGDGEDAYYEIYEVFLYEGSTVPFGMNEHTPLYEVKSGKVFVEEVLEVEKKIDVLTSALRVSGMSDETYMMLERQKEEIKKKYREMILLHRKEPTPAVTQEDEPDHLMEKQIKEQIEKQIKKLLA